MSTARPPVHCKMIGKLGLAAVMLTTWQIPPTDPGLTQDKTPLLKGEAVIMAGLPCDAFEVEVVMVAIVVLVSSRWRWSLYASHRLCCK